MADSGLRLYLAEGASDAVATEIWTQGYQYDRGWGEASLQQAVDFTDNHHDTRGGRVRCLVAPHCHWCTPTDVGLLARNGVSMVHCAATSSRRGYNRLGNIPATCPKICSRPYGSPS